MFEVDLRDVKKLEKDLKVLNKRAIPFATRATLNDAAFYTRQESLNQIRKELVLRNKFTEQSIRVDRAVGIDIKKQKSEVGSIAEYMKDQELGGTKSKEGSRGIPIPTSFAAGQGENTIPRTKLPTRSNKLQTIQLKKRNRRAKNSKQDLLFKVQDAVKTNNRYLFLKLGQKRKWGIYRVKGGSPNFKSGWPTGAQLKLVYSLGRDNVTIPKKPWLKPNVDKAQAKFPAFYQKALQFQLKRLGLFK